MKAILVDDEIHCTESLSILLAKYCPTVEVIGKYNKAPEALDALQTTPCDLLFLDIEMPVYNGFELLNRIPNPTFEVVFTTAYDQFAVKAFRYSAFDYLLKPIDAEELMACVKKLAEKQSQATWQEQMSLLKSVLSHAQPTPHKLALPTSGGVEFVNIADIIRCESDSNYTRIHLAGRPFILICKTLKEVEELLDGANFVRIHHSHLINLDHLKRYVRSDGGYVVMSDGSTLGVSRSRKDVLANLLQVRTFGG
jgi:two-component system LytT family response regulator